ncbi:unnamed protein product [Linum trigynum]|uniref:Uncharacterized protein n=1 Tax=Linum trigynum TaxID=586398 RepID=A0AAV2FDF1_9ROSI
MQLAQSHSSSSLQLCPNIIQVDSHILDHAQGVHKGNLLNAPLITQGASHPHPIQQGSANLVVDNLPSAPCIIKGSCVSFLPYLPRDSMEEARYERPLPCELIYDILTSNNVCKAMRERSLELDQLQKEEPNYAAKLTMAEEMVDDFLRHVAEGTSTRKIPSSSFQVLVS